MKRHPEADMAVKFTWAIVPLAFTLATFWLGTIWAPPDSVLDMQLPDIQFGAKTALIGLTLGVVFATVVTMLYPKADERELHAIEAHEVEEEQLGAF